MITKQAINRLMSAKPTVRLVNGCFNVVEAKALYSGNKRYELRFEVTHPFLEWQCGNKNEVTLVLWKGCCGEQIDIPEELDQLIEKMKVLGTMSDDEASKLSAENAVAITEAYREMGWK